MTKIPPLRYECRPRKGTSPFGTCLTIRTLRTASMGTLDSELVRRPLLSPPTSDSSTMSRKRSDFDKLPAELRVMIFTLALGDEWNGKTPALIKALRTEENVYTACMVSWYKQDHTYTLHEKNSWSFRDMSANAISTITKVKIVIDEQIALHPLLRWSDMRVVDDRLPMSLHDLAVTAKLGTSITSVSLDCRPSCTNLYYWYPQKFFLYLSGFKSLKYAAVTCPIRPGGRVMEGGVGRVEKIEDGMVCSMWQANSMRNGVEKTNEMLGGMAKMGRVYADKIDKRGETLHRRFQEREMWVWVAEEGKSLKPVILPEGLTMAYEREL
ncbi:uncharacterized protein RSE6_10733 [Rhynchosporium secalis]|uniref:Uncharacterized protein n=1 Tax=Rhynchosporium secalis TaxID=38038 RepID=A0A1E1ML75_RHYSE|nr:uncharacterized protein RSE6_10733 [Rhynchosporium secalis]